MFASYFKFTVVRNPWERLLSDYNYQLRKSRPEDSRLLVHDPDGGRRNFAAWASLALSTGEACAPATWGGEVSPGIHRFSPQVDWISVDGRVGVDFVARLETIDEDFERIRAAAGLAVWRLPRRNSRLHAHYSWYYDDLTRDLVADRYAADIAEFGYRFEEPPPASLVAWLARAAGGGIGPDRGAGHLFRRRRCLIQTAEPPGGGYWGTGARWSG